MRHVTVMTCCCNCCCCHVQPGAIHVCAQLCSCTCRYYLVLSVAYGLMSNLDIGTENLRCVCVCSCSLCSTACMLSRLHCGSCSAGTTKQPVHEHTAKCLGTKQLWQLPLRAMQCKHVLSTTKLAACVPLICIWLTCTACTGLTKDI
jgi:hypothetical protein